MAQVIFFKELSFDIKISWLLLTYTAGKLWKLQKWTN
jgi:hypothetical protein